VNRKARLPGYFVAVVVVVLGGVALLAGCQKTEPRVDDKSAQAAPEPTNHDATATSAPQATQVAEQTSCPVMGGAIDKSVFTEYKGKKVYFCCASCLDTFKANPEKYISKLPQFAK
jgi:Cu(I)/Ag(I) efflux system membrane fusion protein